LYAFILKYIKNNTTCLFIFASRLQKNKLDDKGIWNTSENYTIGQIVCILNPNTSKRESYVCRLANISMIPYLHVEQWTFITRCKKVCRQCDYYYKKYMYGIAISADSQLSDNFDPLVLGFKVTCTVPAEAYDLENGKDVNVVFIQSGAGLANFGPTIMDSPNVFSATVTPVQNGQSKITATVCGILIEAVLTLEYTLMVVVIPPPLPIKVNSLLSSAALYQSGLSGTNSSRGKFVTLAIEDPNIDPENSSYDVSLYGSAECHTLNASKGLSFTFTQLPSGVNKFLLIAFKGQEYGPPSLFAYDNTKLGNNLSRI
jgi:hypothetical protein